MFTSPAVAVTREVPASYSECLREDASSAIDVELARQQHEAYVAALREAGVEVHVIPSDDAHPDSLFAEDVAVVLERRALITLPGAESRRSETAEMDTVLSTLLPVEHMSAPATLEGGDVLRVMDRLAVGRSHRSNDAGIGILRQIAGEEGLKVDVLPVQEGLHLKSSMSLVDEGTVICSRGIDAQHFIDLGMAVLRAPEPEGANVLALGKLVLVSAAAPRTAELLSGKGFDVKTLDVSEIHKGDGALTCLSIRIPPPGDWCA